MFSTRMAITRQLGHFELRFRSLTWKNFPVTRKRACTSERVKIGFHREERRRATRRFITWETNLRNALNFADDVRRVGAYLLRTGFLRVSEGTGDAGRSREAIK